MDHSSEAALSAHMRYLADDLLEGRGTGTRGQELAAKYVAEEFEAAELEPAGVDGTYFQRVPFREIAVIPSTCELAITHRSQGTPLRWGADFIMNGNPFSTDSSVEAALVFVGFGVVNRGRDYDDYVDINVRGKIVAMLTGAPSTFPSGERAHFSSGRVKQKEAASRGAIGIIYLRTPDAEKILPWERWVIGTELPGFRWLDSNGVPNDAFEAIKVVAMLSRAAGERLFADAEKSWAGVLKDAAVSKPQRFALPSSARLRSVSHHSNVTSPNVVAVLRGSDPVLAQEYVVYTAHTDHLGVGRPVNHDSIYNGAVDDASGVSALIEIARGFADLPKPPARSIMFLAVTVEEKGLLGSDYFVHFPTVPIRSLVTDANMDVASMLYTFKDIIPLGAEHTTLEDIVTRDAGQLGLAVSPDPMPEQVSFVRSDHYLFVRQGVPAISLSEGLQAKDPKVDGR